MKFEIFTKISNMMIDDLPMLVRAPATARTRFRRFFFSPPLFFVFRKAKCAARKEVVFAPTLPCAHNIKLPCKNQIIDVL